MRWLLWNTSKHPLLYVYIYIYMRWKLWLFFYFVWCWTMANLSLTGYPTSNTYRKKFVHLVNWHCTVYTLFNSNNINKYFNDIKKSQQKVCIWLAKKLSGWILSSKNLRVGFVAVCFTFFIKFTKLSCRSKILNNKNVSVNIYSLTYWIINPFKSVNLTIFPCFSSITLFQILLYSGCRRCCM